MPQHELKTLCEALVALHEKDPLKRVRLADLFNDLHKHKHVRSEKPISWLKQDRSELLPALRDKALRQCLREKKGYRINLEAPESVEGRPIRDDDWLVSLDKEPPGEWEKHVKGRSGPPDESVGSDRLITC